MCTIDPTVGGASANSYATIAAADAYYDAHPHASAWTEASETEKCQALQTATRRLDAVMEWDGVTASETQALLWPRRQVYGANGYLISETALPRELVHATAELARLLLASDLTADLAVDVQGVQSMTVGPMSFTFRGDAQSKSLPDSVYYLVSHLGSLKSRGAGAVPLQRV